MLHNNSLPLRILKKCGVIFIQLIGSVLSVGGVSFILLLSYLSVSPLYLDFLIPYLKPHFSALSSEVSCKRICLTWREWKHPFELDLEDFSVRFQNHKDMRIPQLAIHLDFLQALQGKIVISKATLRKPTFSLEDPGETSNFLTVETMARLFDPSFLKGFTTLVLQEPTVLTSSCQEPLEWPGFSLTLRRKKDRVMLEVALKSNPFMTGDLHFNTPAKTLDIFALFNNVPAPPTGCLVSAFPEFFSKLKALPLLSGSFQGAYHVKDKKWIHGEGFLTQAKKKPQSTVSSPRISKDFWVFEGVETHVILKGDHLQLKRLVLQLDGLALQINGNLNQKTGEFSSTLRTLGPISLPLLSFLWPQIVAPNPREWIFTNMADGVIKDISITSSGKWQKKQEISALTISGQMAIEGMRVSYLKGMPVVENACGKATFDQKQFLITLTKGALEQQILKQGTILIGNLDQGKESFSLDIALEGPLQNLLSLIDQPPLAYGRALNLKPKSFQGTALTRLKLSFPLKKDLLLKEIDVDVASHLTNVKFSLFMEKEKFALNLQKGVLDLQTTKKELSLKGKAEVNGHPAQVFWKEKFDTAGGRIYGLTVPMTSQELFASWDIDLRNWVSGPFTVSLSYQAPKATKAPSFLKIQADFQNASIDLPFLSWKKPEKQGAIFSGSLEQHRQGKSFLNTIHMKAKDLEVFGEMTFFEGKTLERLYLSKLKAPETQASVLLTYDPLKGYALTLTGESFNFASLFSQTPIEKGRFLKMQTPFVLSLNLGKGLTGKGRQINQLSANLTGRQGVDHIEWEQAQISGVAGQRVPPLSQKNLPQPGSFFLTFNNRKLFVRANDAGAFFKILGLHNEIEGGALLLESQQADVRKPYKGRIQIKDFAVQDMPILTRLLALASPAGLIEFLSSEALRFSQFDASFSALNDQIIIHKARGVSAGLGVAFKGTVNQKERSLFLVGNIIPAEMLNSLLSSIPLIGEVFFGGKDSGFLATRFTVKGPLSNPQMEVNPLYSLTPGFLKRFFEDDEEEEKNLRIAEQEMQVKP